MSPSSSSSSFSTEIQWFPISVDITQLPQPVIGPTALRPCCVQRLDRPERSQAVEEDVVAPVRACAGAGVAEVVAAACAAVLDADGTLAVCLVGVQAHVEGVCSLLVCVVWRGRGGGEFETKAVLVTLFSTSKLQKLSVLQF